MRGSTRTALRLTTIAQSAINALIIICVCSFVVSPWYGQAWAQAGFTLSGEANGQKIPSKKSAQLERGRSQTFSEKPSKGDDQRSARGETRRASQPVTQARSDTGSTPQPSASSETEESNQAQRGQTKITIGKERRLPNDRVPVSMRASSRDGATGLYHIYSADPGPQGTVRFSLSASGFSTQEFLTVGVEERFSRGDISVAYTPLEFLEVYTSLRSMSYTNPLSSPSYIQGQGDLKFGAKVGRFWDTLGAGLATGVQIFSDPEGSGWKGGAASFDVHALFTADLTRQQTPVPFRFLLDVHFTKENSEALTAGLNAEPSLVQEWGYQSGRYDRLMLNFGIEVPTRYVSPFASYHIGTPFLVEMPRMGQYSRVFAFESVPHFISGGVRGFPLPEVALEFGGTLGISDAPFTGVPATPPWTVWGGVTYTLDPRPKVVEREIKIEPPPPPKPEPPKPLGTLVRIQVINAQDKKPISGAQLSFVGAPLSALVSDDQGMFSGYRLAPKKYVIQVTAPGYLSRKLRLSIKKGREELKAKLKLKPDPQGTEGELIVKWSPQDPSASTQLELNLYGPETHKAVLIASAPFKVKLKPGDYVLIVKDRSGKRYQDVFTLGGNGEALREIKPEMLTTSGAVDGVDVDSAPDKARSELPLKGSTKWVRYNLKRKRLSAKVKVGFIGEGAKLNKGSARAVRGLAQYLNDEPRIKKIVVMVHTHSRGDPRADKKLGYRRGQTIKKLLTSEGISASRVSVYSYGSEKNTASNMSRRGRQRNQRVAFRIKSVDL